MSTKKIKIVKIIPFPEDANQLISALFGLGMKQFSFDGQPEDIDEGKKFKITLNTTWEFKSSEEAKQQVGNLPKKTIKETTKFCAAAKQETDRKIKAVLDDGLPHSFKNLLAQTELSRATLSKHLKILPYTSKKRVGISVFYQKIENQSNSDTEPNKTGGDIAKNFWIRKREV